MTTSEAVAEPVVQATPTPAARTMMTIEEAVKDIVTTGKSGSFGAKVSAQDVRIFSTHVEVEVKGIKKAISLMDFKQMIDSQLQVETKMDMMSLPEGCYQIAKSATEIQVACYHPERKLDLKHMTKLYKGCMVPNIIISQKLRYDNGSWIVQDTRYFATDKTLGQLPENTMIWDLDPINHIWLLPFPNMYAEGRMCFGGNIMPVKFTNNLKGLKYYYDVIPASSFNNDLGVQANWRDGIEAWFTHLTKLEKFDYQYMRGR